MNLKTQDLESIPDGALSRVHGGGFLDYLKGWAQVANAGKATGTGPSSLMEIFENPPRALNWARDTLGIAPSGKPGDIYHPATANGDGSITDGFFETPRDPSAPQVPTSF
jgi:hypothetical protein